MRRNYSKNVWFNAKSSINFLPIIEAGIKEQTNIFSWNSSRKESFGVFQTEWKSLPEVFKRWIVAWATPNCPSARRVFSIRLYDCAAIKEKVSFMLTTKITLLLLWTLTQRLDVDSNPFSTYKLHFTTSFFHGFQFIRNSQKKFYSRWWNAYKLIYFSSVLHGNQKLEKSH